MAKGYWIAAVDVEDADTYSRYVAANAGPFAQYGARFLARAGDHVVVEGSMRSRQVILEFATYEDAVRCYESPEYQAAKAIRVVASVGDVVIIEGYDGPQPGDSADS